MSTYLNNQLLNFQGDVSSASSRLSKKSTAQSTSTRPTSTTTTTTTTTTIPPFDLKRKRPETPQNIVYSQPADTGTGKHLMTQVTYAVNYLKTKPNPIPFRDVFAYLSVPDIDDHGMRTLERILQAHAKVDFDPAGCGGLGGFRFRPTHNVRSADELLAFLQVQPTAQGIQVKELKDGWLGALDAVDALEAAGRLLVTRNKKDDSARMVWPDDPSLAHAIDKEFQELWHKIRLPAESADLRKALVEEGLVPTSVVKVVVAGGAGKKKKKPARRGGKTTNTHMAGVLRDFSHMRPVK